MCSSTSLLCTTTSRNSSPAILCHRFISNSLQSYQCSVTSRQPMIYGIHSPIRTSSMGKRGPLERAASWLDLLKAGSIECLTHCRSLPLNQLPHLKFKSFNQSRFGVWGLSVGWKEKFCAYRERVHVLATDGERQRRDPLPSTNSKIKSFEVTNRGWEISIVRNVNRRGVFKP